jgi:hypothetical protein
MNVTVQKLTGAGLAQKACKFTLHSHADTEITLDRLYRAEHSPIRTQLFWVEMLGIPNFVSVHFVRHKVGVEHFVQTMRTDRGAEEIANRLTPTNHAMLANAQALVNMGRKRLCHKASQETREVMVLIRKAMCTVDPALTRFMVPECVYRGGICHEIKPCWQMEGVVWSKF